MVLVKLFDPFSLILWGTAITLMMLAGLLYLNKGRQLEGFKGKINIYGLGFFIIGFGIASYFMC